MLKASFTSVRNKTELLAGQDKPNTVFPERGLKRDNKWSESDEEWPSFHPALSHNWSYRLTPVIPLSFHHSDLFFPFTSITTTNLSLSLLSFSLRASFQISIYISFNVYSDSNLLYEREKNNKLNYAWSWYLINNALICTCVKSVSLIRCMCVPGLLSYPLSVCVCVCPHPSCRLEEAQLCSEHLRTPGERYCVFECMRGSLRVWSILPNLCWPFMKHSNGTKSFL